MSSFTPSSEMSQESKSASTSSAKDSKKKSCYDVYLSFCAKDSPDFILKLHTALRTYVKGSLVFFDNKKLESEDQEITASESSLSIIEECKIAVVIFSRNYTNSRSCLQELEKITECCQTTAGLIVVPVLYPVYPSLQGGTFGAAFHEFVDRVLIKEISQQEDRIMAWVAAISKATKHSEHYDDRNM